MEKMKMRSPDLVAENINKIVKLFPQCLVECRDESGKLTRKIDFEALQQELAGSVIDGSQERYMLNWPGKREAILLANSPVAKTLRPCREESVDFDNTKNLYIEGDNLDVLKLLRDTYLGKVKMIYIDPPYNTGNDFIYEDDFAEDSESYLLKSNQIDDQGARLAANPETKGRYHSDWLTMIYPRLRLAHQLLRDDGVIFISIDDNEVHNLRKVCDEIFGEENFIADLIWEKRFTRNNDAKLISSVLDHNLFYRKSHTLALIREPRTEKANSIYSNPDNDPRGVWTSVSYVSQRTKDQRPNLSYEILNPITGIKVAHEVNAWKYSKEQYEIHARENRLYWGKNGENSYPRLKRFLAELDEGMVPVNLWRYEEVGTLDDGTKEVNGLLGKDVFDYPKPSSLIKKMLLVSGAKNSDIILDFFSGSATTAHSIMKLNDELNYKLRFIMIQLPEACSDKGEASKFGYAHICEVGKERIRRAGAKIKTEWEKKQKKNENDLFAENGEKLTLDVGFRVLKLDSSNMEDVYYTPDAIEQDMVSKYVDNIKDGRTAEDLLFQVMLDWGVELSLPVTVEKLKGKTVYFVDGDAIAACFDSGITDELIQLIAERKVLRAVFRDNGFTDSSKINVVEIFKQLSPSTDIKVI
jgi:adenine-specific DNA-methyltransferase